MAETCSISKNAEKKRFVEKNGSSHSKVNSKTELKVILCSYMSNFQSSLCVYFETSFFLLSPRETQALVVLSLSDVAHCCVVQAIQSHRVQIVRSLSLLHFFIHSPYTKKASEKERCLHLLFNARLSRRHGFFLCVFSLSLQWQERY